MLKVREMSDSFYYSVDKVDYRIAFEVGEGMWDVIYYGIDENPLEEWDWLSAHAWAELASFMGWDVKKIPEMPFIEVAFGVYGWYGPTDTFGESYFPCSKKAALETLKHEEED